MRFFFTIIIFVCLFSKNFAQSSNDFTEMLQEAERNLYTQPEETIKIVNHLLQNSKNPRQKIQAYIYGTAAYYAMGKFDSAIQQIIEAKNLAENTEDSEMQIKISIESIHVLNHLGLNLVAEEYYLRTTNSIQNKNPDKKQPYLDGGLALIKAYKFIESNNLSEAFDSFQEANSIFEKIPDKILFAETTTAILEMYLKVKNIDTAENYFKSILKNTDGESPNIFLKMIVLNQMGYLQFQKKEYSESLNFYKKALEISKQLNNKAYSSKIMEGLSAPYLALEKTTLFYSNRTESNQLANEVEIEEDKAVNSIYNYINNNHISRLDLTKKTYRNNVLILSSILIFLLLSSIVLRYRYRYRAKQYESFINYFENKQKPIEIVPEREIGKSLNIPKETEEALVQKLIQFENSKYYTKQDMSLAMLASHFDTNTKYLSEIINTHKNKNFNSYINELRINYITEKLKNNHTYLQYKISYLAEESGFSSHSSFATVFKTVTGIPPTVFIELLKTKKLKSKAVVEEYENA